MVCIDSPSKNEHFLDAVIQQCLPESLVKLLTTGNSLPLHVPHSLLLHFRPPQRDAVERARAVKIGNHKFIGQLVLLLLIGVHYGPALKSADRTRNHQILHADAGINKGQTNAIEHCAFGTTLVLDHTDKYLNLMLFIKILNDGALKTASNIFCKFTELPIVPSPPLLERTERGNSVLDPQHEVAVAWPLVRSVDET